MLAKKKYLCIQKHLLQIDVYTEGGLFSFVNVSSILNFGNNLNQTAVTV